MPNPSAILAAAITCFIIASSSLGPKAVGEGEDSAAWTVGEEIVGEREPDVKKLETVGPPAAAEALELFPFSWKGGVWLEVAKRVLEFSVSLQQD